MQWRQETAWYQVSDCGYTVSKSLGADGAKYSAWGPDAAAGWNYRDSAKGQCAHWAGEQLRERYRVGEPVPQRYALLGCCATVAAARRLCVAAAGAESVSCSQSPPMPTA